MSKLEKIKKDIKKLEKLKLDIDTLEEDRKRELQKRIKLLELRNCSTCKRKKCIEKNKKDPLDNCDDYHSKEYKYMLKMKEGIK